MDKVQNQFLLKYDEIPHRAEILEAGCGMTTFSIALSRFGRRIHGTDLSKGSLNEAKKFIDKINIKNVQFYRMNIFKLYFKKIFLTLLSRMEFCTIQLMQELLLVN